MRNSLKILLLSVNQPEKSSFQRGLGYFVHSVRRAVENFLTDTLCLGGYFVEFVGRAKEPAVQSLTRIDEHLRLQHRDRLLAAGVGLIILIALLY